MKCLIVKKPWIDQILSGQKTKEFRTSATNIRGKIGLIASGGRGKILGTVEICGVETCDNSGFGRFAWLLENPVRFDFPLSFDQPIGCVIWVNTHDFAPHNPGHASAIDIPLIDR